MPAEVARAVDGVLDKRARKHAGIVVGVRRDGGTTVAARGRVADDRPQPPDERTIFEIGSITKVVTATLLADLAREGLVALNVPVRPRRGRRSSCSRARRGRSTGSGSRS